MTEDEKSTAKLIINPTSTVAINEEIFRHHEPASTKEDWVLLNADLIKSIGVSAWLSNLLDVLTVSAEEYDGHDIINPTLTIPVSENLRTALAQTVKRDEWVAANSKLIKEIGEADWLWLLLDVLETGRV